MLGGNSRGLSAHALIHLNARTESSPTNGGDLSCARVKPLPAVKRSSL
jgi:hypothetical protein